MFHLYRGGNSNSTENGEQPFILFLSTKKKQLRKIRRASVDGIMSRNSFFFFHEEGIGPMEEFLEVAFNNLKKEL